MDTIKKSVTIYVRKSRLKDDDEMEMSRQVELLIEFAEDNNMDYKVFYEEGSSEDWEGRKELQKMLKELQNNMYDGVLVTEQDRISRDATDMGIFKRFCKKEGLMLFTLNKTYNFMDDDDNFITGIQAEMDSHFMRILKRKMLRGRIQALESGVYFGTPPYGYHKSPVKPKILIKNPVESKVIEMIFDLYANKGVNQTEIAEKVNLLGYKTRELKNFTSRSISLILSNVAYIGTLHYELQGREPIIVENAHESLISTELFNSTQVLRREKRVVPQRSKMGRYLLSSLIKCPKCKTTLSFCMKYTSRAAGRALNKDDRIAFVLNCHSSLTASKQAVNFERCSNMGVKAWRIEESVIESLEKQLYEIDVEIDLIVQEGSSMFEEVHSKIEQFNIRLKELDEQRKRVQEGYTNGIYDAEEGRLKLKEIKEDRIKIEFSKEKIEKMDSSTEIDRMQKTKEKILTLLSDEGLDVVESNKLLREVIECVYYYKDKPDYKKLNPLYLEIVYK